MLYLVTGGAGFLGLNLVRFLLTHGHSVRSLDIAAFDYPERAAIDEICGDIRDRAAVERAMSGVDMVAHCAAALPLYDPAEIFSTNVDGTRLVPEGAFERGVSRLVHFRRRPSMVFRTITRSTRTIGCRGSIRMASPRSAPSACDWSTAPKVYASLSSDRSLLSDQSGLAPSLLFDWASEGHNFPVLGRGDNRYQLLDVEDLCRAIDLCATPDRDRVNDTFNVGAKDFSAMRQDFQTVLDHAGYGRRIVSLPETPAVWALKALEALHLSPLYQWVYETAGKDSFVSVERIEQRLGFIPKFSNREALIRNFDWYLAHRDQFHGTSGISHRAPWKQGALRLAKHVF